MPSHFPSRVLQVLPNPLRHLLPPGLCWILLNFRKVCIRIITRDYHHLRKGCTVLAKCVITPFAKSYTALHCKLQSNYCYYLWPTYVANEGLAHSTIKVYLSAIRNCHICHRSPSNLCQSTDSKS